jgi:hypothetical protein
LLPCERSGHEPRSITEQVDEWLVICRDRTALYAVAAEFADDGVDIRYGYVWIVVVDRLYVIVERQVPAVFFRQPVDLVAGLLQRSNSSIDIDGEYSTGLGDLPILGQAPSFCILYRNEFFCMAF